MGKIKKIKIGGREVDAELIDVNQTSEKWNEYLLDDGSVVRIKLVLKKVYRIAGQYDPEGNPVYVVESQNILSTNSPDHLKRK